MEMRSGERDALLMLLAMAAGSADAWSYFGIGHSFVANMTGNTVLIGVSLVREQGDLLHPLISLCGYALGVATGALLTRKVKPQMAWPRAVSRTLLLEAALLLLTEAGLTRHLKPNLLLVVLAFAIGMQSGALLQMKIPGVVTTYITGTWTNLMSGITRLFSHSAKPAEGGVRGLEERMFLQAGILLAYLLSAIMAGLLLRYFPIGTGMLPAIAVAIAAVYGLVRT